MVHSSGDENEAVALVLDVGSYTMSYGVSGEETPGFTKLATYTKDGTEGGKVQLSCVCSTVETLGVFRLLLYHRC